MTVNMSYKVHHKITYDDKRVDLISLKHESRDDAIEHIILETEDQCDVTYYELKQIEEDLQTKNNIKVGHFEFFIEEIKSTMVLFCESAQNNVWVEDSGKAKYIVLNSMEFPQDLKPPESEDLNPEKDELFLRIHSWNENGKHKNLDQLIGKKLQIIIDVLA